MYLTTQIATIRTFVDSLNAALNAWYQQFEWNVITIQSMQSSPIVTVRECFFLFRRMSTSIHGHGIGRISECWRTFVLIFDHKAAAVSETFSKNWHFFPENSYCFHFEVQLDLEWLK